MSDYRRLNVAGGTYFITQVTYQRVPWLCGEVGRRALREAIAKVRVKYPFEIDAFVLLPEHFHCLLTLPLGDKDFSVRLRLIKSYVTKHYGGVLEVDQEVSASREKRRESNLWQRRFWEHLIQDEQDYFAHYDYIHNNPVRHGLCTKPEDWEFSSIHRFIKQGIYAINRNPNQNLEAAIEMWDDQE
jgi:putative transposase